jgi:hypothetical protein
MAKLDLAGNDNPKEIADYLIQEHGRDEAIEVAMQGVAKANASGDNYSLSIWREVRSLLKNQP